MSIQRTPTGMMSEQPEFETPAPSRWPLVLWLILGAAAVLLGMVLLVWSPAEPLAIFDAAPVPGDGATHPAVGAKIERLALQPLTGNPPPLAAADLSGRVTLINFWGPWCGYCLLETPQLNELQQHYRSNSDFRFVSVSCSQPGGVDPELADHTAEFLHQQQADFPTYTDADDVTRIALAIDARERGIPFPTTVLIGRDGAIFALWFGYRPNLDREMREAVEDALRARPAATGGPK
jgi:thiol-disulfide isomerase/thioredoxin